MMFIYSFQSEWLKKKRSAAAALVWGGAFFIPLLMLIIRLKKFRSLASDNASPGLWDSLYGMSWQFMAFFLLPLGVMLATSLITQLEYRNNTWKQVHTTPQDMSTILLSKLSILLVMLLQFFLLFNIGIWLAGVLPAVFKGVAFPRASFPWVKFLQGSGYFFIDSLPIVGLQYLVSLQFRNFLAPLGIGIALYVASMIAIEWEYGYTIPYNYSALEFFVRIKGNRLPSANIHVWALVYFAVFIILSYILYRSKKDKS
jgi:hypothetical protein